VKGARRVARHVAGWRRRLRRSRAARRALVLSGARCRVPRKTEVTVAGQLALVIETELVVPPAVWEALPPERQLQVALRLARLLARLVEAARDE
jgi:hypothetical protein